MNNKVLKHLQTVHTHRKNVRELCFKCGLIWQGLTHDLSKYSPTEFLPGIKYWTGTKSPHESEIAEKGYSVAWLHHMGTNKHHPEYWIDPAHTATEPAQSPNPNVDWIFCEMPFKYVAEMFCDRVAASKTYLGDKYTDASALEYAKGKEDKESKLVNRNTYKLLIQLLIDLSRYGEDAVCSYIRKAVALNKQYGVTINWNESNKSWEARNKNKVVYAIQYKSLPHLIQDVWSFTNTREVKRGE